jgi:hypothetical protein
MHTVGICADIGMEGKTHFLKDLAVRIYALDKTELKTPSIFPSNFAKELVFQVTLLFQFPLPSYAFFLQNAKRYVLCKVCLGKKKK